MKTICSNFSGFFLFVPHLLLVVASVVVIVVVVVVVAVAVVDGVGVSSPGFTVLALRWRGGLRGRRNLKDPFIIKATATATAATAATAATGATPATAATGATTVTATHQSRTSLLEG